MLGTLYCTVDIRSVVCQHFVDLLLNVFCTYSNALFGFL